MGDPNTGEIYEGLLRNEGDVPLNHQQAEWLKSIPVRDRVAELKAMQAKLRGEMVSDPPPSREMPRYKSHKEVWALKIADIQPPEGQRPAIAQLEEFLGRHGQEAQMTPDGAILAITGAVITPAEEGYAPFTVSPEYMRRHKPQVGGYFVSYKDGYQSFSPAQAFEEVTVKFVTPESVTEVEMSETERLQRSADAWEETALRHCRNEQFYHGIIDQLGPILGPEVYTSDDGSVNDSVLALKVVEACQKLATEKDETVSKLNLALLRKREVYEYNETLRARCAEIEAALIDEANQLERWANESREGGWSTHQVDPMRRRADGLRRIATLRNNHEQS